MPPTPTQSKRLLAIGTDLGDDVLLLKAFSIREQLGRMFQIDVELLSDDTAIDFDQVVGTNATVRLELPSGGTRHFNGFVSRFSQGESVGKFAAYRASIVPWLWFLTRTADCRIFQQKTVPQILEDVFKAHGFKEFKLKLNASYQPWEYCVQYRETDFSFVSRLMEQEGIYYFFEHADGNHTMVLADGAASHEPYEGYAEMIYRPPTRHSQEMGETVSDWVIEREVQPGAYAMADFNFKTTVAPILGNASISRSHPAASFEMFDYPGQFDKMEEGEHYAKVRLEELQAQHEILRAQATVRGVCAGFKFKLAEHPRDDQNDRDYLITAMSCEARAGEYESGTAKGAFFSCSFAAMPASEPFRAARSTPKPVIQGPQTAIVVGKKGEEIDTDEYGRVRVQFHWDRYGKVDENSSCWVRVAQIAAGKGWGGISIPRIGQEVIVEFLEGDPDQPIITGRVYNAKSTVPYPLPDNKTISTFKSNSSKGGGGFNEVRLEDKKGEEKVFVHAEKDLDVRVKNDRCETIGHDRHLVVEHDKKEHIKNERHETVDQKHVERVGGDRHVSVGGQEAIEITGKHSFTVKDDVVEVFKKNHSEGVTENYYLKAKNVVIEAEENITLHVGDSFIAIDAQGIKIATNGKIALDAKDDITQKTVKNLTIEATMNVGVKGTAGLKLESPAPAEVSSSAILTLKGSMVKIN